MTISAALNAARTGLQATGMRAELVATNVANANTPGYVRRSVVMAENILAGQTDGVRTAGVTRVQNQAIAQERRDLSSDLAQSNVLAATWQSIDARLGADGDDAPLFEAYRQLESALGDLAVTPESTIGQSRVLEAAKSITTEFRDLSSMVVNLRAEADRGIAEGVERVNSALQRIEVLNGDIAGTDQSSSTAAALADERDRALDTIAEYLPVRTAERENGAIDVLTREGVFLVSGKAKTLAFESSRAFGPDQTLANGALSGLAVDGVVLTPNAPTYGAVSGGAFAALFAVRDSEAAAFNDQLDTVAQDLFDRFSDDAIDPTKPPGAPGLFTDLSGTGGVGLSGRLAVNAAVDPAQGGEVWRLRDGLGAVSQGPTGDASRVDAMIQALDGSRAISIGDLDGVFSAADLVGHFASMTGHARVQADSVLASTSAQHALASEAEQSISGVDTDAEMQSLLSIEQAYAANARVIQAASDMLDRLMAL